MFYSPTHFPSHRYSHETFKLKLHFVEGEKENVLFVSHHLLLSLLSASYTQSYPKGCSGLSLGLCHARGGSLVLIFFLPAETVVIPTVHFSCANATAFLGCSINYVSEMIWVLRNGKPKEESCSCLIYV